MIFVRGGKPLSKPDPDLSKAIDNLLEHQRKEEELCPRCINDNNGSYNPVCANCDDFCNFKEKEERKMSDIHKIVNEVTMHVQETRDEFIFSILNKYAMDNFNMVVEKEELIRAIQLIRMCKEYGPGIDERWTTATQQTEVLNDAYLRGLQDGVEKASRKERVAKAAQELDPIVNAYPCKRCSDDVRMTCKKCNEYYDWIDRLKGEKE